MSATKTRTPHPSDTVSNIIPDGGRVWMPALFDADRRAVDPRLVWLAAAIPAKLLAKTGTGRHEGGDW